MSERAEIVRAIRRAAKQREKAERMRQDATAQLRESCEKAQAAGIPITEIAREAGVSRQAVYDFLREQPGQGSP